MGFFIGVCKIPGCCFNKFLGPSCFIYLVLSTKPGYVFPLSLSRQTKFFIPQHIYLFNKFHYVFPTHIFYRTGIATLIVAWVITHNNLPLALRYFIFVE